MTPQARRERAERMALTLPAPCVCREVALCNQHKWAVDTLFTFAEQEVRAERKRWEQGAARAEGLLRKFWDGESSDAVLVADAAAELVNLLRHSPAPIVLTPPPA